VRLLGEPSAGTDKLLTYRFPTETAFVSLITNRTPTANLTVLKPGTVESIQVYPGLAVYIADLGLDEKRVRRINGSRPEFIGTEAYVDENAGLVIKTSGTRIETIFYFGSAQDRESCPGCTVNPQSLADMPICTLCATVSVTSPVEVRPGENALFTANVSVGSPPPELTFNWTIDGGRILQGQGTSSIVVDTKGVKSNSVTATVDVGGIDPTCNHTSSSSTQIAKRPPN